MSVPTRDLLTGVGLDLVLGDPRWLPHPIRTLGAWASAAERGWRALPLPPRVSGAAFWMTVVAPFAAIASLTPPRGNVYWIWTMLALRSLDMEGSRVVARLEAGDLQGARRALAMIVGRDTASLGEPEIMRAVVETVSENLNDAVIAPLFYLALFGPTGMAAYKAVNTLDSIVGYKNSKYRDFGYVSAKLDDIAGFIPARLSAVLVSMCAWFFGYDAAGSVRITVRDARLQPSPNSGYPEAAFAGALGVRLGGVNYYGGIPSTKAFLGDDVRPLGTHVYRQARQLLYGASAIMVALICGVSRWR